MLLTHPRAEQGRGLALSRQCKEYSVAGAPGVSGPSGLPVLPGACVTCADTMQPVSTLQPHGRRLEAVAG